MVKGIGRRSCEWEWYKWNKEIRAIWRGTRANKFILVTNWSICCGISKKRQRILRDLDATRDDTGRNWRTVDSWESNAVAGIVCRDTTDKARLLKWNKHRQLIISATMCVLHWSRRRNARRSNASSTSYPFSWLKCRWHLIKLSEGKKIRLHFSNFCPAAFLFE